MELLGTERLIQDSQSGLLYISWIRNQAGDQEHSDSWSFSDHPERQVDSVHAWHHHIRDDHVDSASMGSRDFQRLPPVFCQQDGACESRQQFSVLDSERQLRGDVRFFVGEGGSPPPSLGHAVCVFTFGDAN
jgi:hypothetical protein